VTNQTEPAQHEKMTKNGLTYTRMGLMALFGYLLMGDFCLQIMEMVIPSVMPLQLAEAEAPDTVKAILMVSMVSLFNLTINPLVSFRSDNVRTRWGRRIPFLLAMTPCVVATLVAIAYAPEIAAFLQARGWQILGLERILSNNPSMGTLMLVMTVGVVFFQIFNYIMAPVFYYLFIDVVPDAYMGRFMALFRIVATLATFIFHTYIFPHALSHTKEIYIGAALLYGVGFMIMSLNVREGTYPPPAHDLRMSPWAQVKVYIRECYSHKHYWFFYLRNTCIMVGGATDMFLVYYFIKALNVSLTDVGRIDGYSQLLILFVLYPLGLLMDKFKPTRVMFWLMLFCLPLPMICFWFITDRPSYLLLGFLFKFLTGIMGNLSLPFYASIPPQERYGQFGSANQVFISIAVIPMGVLAGMFMDFLTQSGTHPEMYRWAYVWNFTFYCASLLFMWLLYRSWKRHGGDNYVPPRVGFETPVCTDAPICDSTTSEATTRDDMLRMPVREDSESER